MSSPTTYVLGLGNVLMGDDGWGPAVVRQFESEYVVGPSVEVVDIGTPGLDLAPWLIDAQRVIVVDTVKTDAAAGTVRVFYKPDILRHLPGARVGPHDPGLKEALLSLDFAGRGPGEVALVGAVPASVAMGLDLSASLEDAIPRAIAAVVAQLRAWGEPVHRRPIARPPAAWHAAPVA